MRFKNQSIATTASFKPYLQRLLLAALMLFSLFLIYADRQGKNWVDQVRLGVSSVALPVANAVASPIEAIQAIGDGWNHLWHVYDENKRLRYENAQLLQWQSSALRLEAENEALRQLLDYQPAQVARYTTAKAVGPTDGNLSHRVQINAGLNEQIGKYFAVINEYGLVGRVASVSGQRAEILLLTDMSSRIPVELQPSGVRAILVGDHDNLPYLKLADPKAKPELGDVVLTSGDGAVMPAGLMVGKLFASRDGRLQVRPAFKQKRLDFVRVVHRANP